MIDFEDLFNSHGIITVCLRMRVLNVCFDHLRNKDSKMNDVHTQNASLYYNYFFKKKIYLPWTDLTPWGEGSFHLAGVTFDFHCHYQTDQTRISVSVFIMDRSGPGFSKI